MTITFKQQREYVQNIAIRYNNNEISRDRAITCIAAMQTLVPALKPICQQALNEVLNDGK